MSRTSIRWPGTTANLYQRALPGASIRSVATSDVPSSPKAFGHESLSRELTRHADIAVTVGDVAEFLGAVPAIPDDPHTPEDEYQTYAYSLQPHVYRQPYADRAGHEAAYYVLNFSVGD